jgi:hypothetical protein
MLHNKSTGLKPDVMSMEGLVNWLEQQPPRKEYTYESHRDCMVAQYLKSNGHEDPFVYSMGHWQDNRGKNQPFPHEFDNVAVDHPRTFGGALKRAKAYL